MLSVSPQFSSFGWLLDDPLISHEELTNNCYFSTEKIQTSGDSIGDLHSPNSSKNGGFASSFDELVDDEGNPKNVVKKLNHNASERDRRKRINTLYFTLRSLLPQEDQSGKLSIPATVSKVLKYIPEQQKEIDRLNLKKERLIMSKISSQEETLTTNLRKKRRIEPNQSTLSALSVTQISDEEIIIQSSISKVEKANSFSEALLSLEQERLFVKSASCFDSCEGRVFYNLHLQVCICEFFFLCY
ncbi:hypothetical protein RD792_008161 [Penstemon davidsonii]|uniref:BHLH domain-containing protein n=1 Tax=Penstemon davidsonii TaxID=160366 RepID=A0ABR0D934_9LAMI|nr:hypothetical protein RD792_008161 [Penstemon davidsonii]